MVSFWQQAAEIITVSAKTKCSNLWDSMHEQHTVQFKHLPQTFRPELTCRLWCCNNSVTLGSSCQVTVWENEASKKQGCEWQKFWQGRNRRRHHALNLTQVAKFLEVEGNKIHKGTSCYKCNTIDTNTNITNNHEMVTLHNTISWRRLSFFFFFFSAVPQQVCCKEKLEHPPLLDLVVWCLKPDQSALKKSAMARLKVVTMAATTTWEHNTQLNK